LEQLPVTIIAHPRGLAFVNGEDEEDSDEE
jgi:hypothetical protein